MCNIFRSKSIVSVCFAKMYKHFVKLKELR